MLADLHSPNFEQIALARFIKMGIFDRHIISQIDNALIFGYGNTKIEQMEKGIRLLADII